MPNSNKNMALYTLLLIGIVLATMIFFTHYSDAAPQQGEKLPDLEQTLSATDGVPPPMMPSMVPGIPMMMGGNPAIAVDNGYVFVVQGNRLLKYNAKTLELAKSVEIIRMQTPPKEIFGTEKKK